MVKVPTDIFIESIDNKKIYYFSSNQLNTKIPHHFICVKRNNNDVLFMSCCTSQFETIRKFVETRSLPLATLVYISPKDTSNPFDKDTYVNCNDIQTYTIDEFRSMYESNAINYSGEISDNYYEQIITGIHSSPLIEEEIKENIPQTIV